MSQPTPRRLSRLLRTTCWTLVLIILLLAATGAYLLRPASIRAFALAGLRQATGAEISLEHAHLSWTGQIRLRDLTIGVPGLDTAQARLLQVVQIDLQPSWRSLWSGRLAWHRIDVHQPVIYLTEEADAERFTFERLRRPRIEEDDRETFLPGLPTIYLHDGRLAMGAILDGRYQAGAIMALDGFLQPVPDHDEQYLFTLQARQQQDVPGIPTIQGSFDLSDRSLIASIRDFTLTAAHTQLLPAFVRLRMDPYQLQGAIEQWSVMIQRQEDDTFDLTSMLMFRDAAITLPFEEAQPRLEHVTGRMLFARDLLEIENLRGQMAGVTYAVRGWVGFGAEPIMHLTLKTDPFEVPERLSQIYTIPAAFKEQYERLQPSGRFVVQVVLRRDRALQPLEVTSTIDVIDGRMTYWKFPYAAEAVEGRIVIRDRTLTIESLTGRGPTGAHISIRGQIAPISRQAAVQLDLRADEVPLDAVLYEALDENARKWFDFYFDDQVLAALREQAAVTDDTPVTREALEHFTLGGTTSLTARIRRPEGSGQRYQNTIVVQAKGLTAMMRAWPYPVHGTAGQVTVLSDRIRIEQVALEGLTGASAVIHGQYMRHPDPDVPTASLIQVRDAHLPVDDLLIASLGPRQRDALQPLRLSGMLTGEATLQRDRSQALRFEAHMQLADGRLRPGESMPWLEQIQGPLLFTPESLTTEGLDFVCEQNAFVWQGIINWSTRPERIDGRIHSDQVTLSAGLLGLIPLRPEQRDSVDQLMQRWQPQAVFALDASLAGGWPDQLDTRVTLAPQSLQLNHGDQQLTLRAMQGTVRMTGRQLMLEQIRGEHDSGSMQVSGVVLLDDEPTWTLDLKASASKLDGNTRAVLPEALRRFVDAAELRGGYELDQARLEQTRGDSDAMGKLSFQGRLNLHNAAARLLLAITEAQATLHIRAREIGVDAVPRLDMVIQSPQLKIEGRQVRNLRTRMISLEHPGQLAAPDLVAEIYGGTLSGQISLDARPQGRYAAMLSLHKVELGPLLRPDMVVSDTADTEGFQARTTDSGLLNAALQVAGQRDQPASRLGRGEVRISDARLFQQPFALALLNTLHFSWPQAGAFDRVRVDYLVRGDSVYFERLSLTAGKVQVQGTGTMTWPQLQLDLDMAARQHDGLNLGALDDMLNVFRDELVAIRVTGSLDAPHAQVVSFEGIRRSWEQIFGPLTGNPPRDTQPRSGSGRQR